MIPFKAQTYFGEKTFRYNKNSNYLSLSYEVIILFPDISTYTNLKILALSSNKLTDLIGIGALTGLTELYLANNLFTKLPMEICKLTNLKLLNLNENQLTILPPEIGALTNLNHLYITDNKLTVLPDISNVNLTYLILDGNKIKNLINLYFQKYLLYDYRIIN